MGVASAIVLWAGCEAPEVGGRRAPLVGGVAAPDDHAVVAVEKRAGGEVLGGCSGTLVGPDVVLTAAHCAPGPGEALRVHFGARAIDDPAPLGDREVIAFEVAPGWNGDHERGHDLAMLRLAAPAPAGIAPIPVLTSAIALLEGTPVRLVGFGLTGEEAETLERRTAETTVSFATDTVAFVGPFGGGAPQICDGDSGGPILAERGGVETVIAVASFSDRLCLSSSAGSRLDVDLAWLARWLGGGLGGAGDAGCAHPLCAEGEPLDAACDPCVAAICARDPFCCSDRWDSGCTQTAELECPATCDKADAPGQPQPAGCIAAGRGARLSLGPLLLALSLLLCRRRRRREVGSRSWCGSGSWWRGRRAQSARYLSHQVKGTR
jgi:hypothetical protein